MTEIIMDPNTGLPLLDENHAFKVESTSKYRIAGDWGIEVDAPSNLETFQVRIVRLSPQQKETDTAVYIEHGWGFFKWSQFSHMEPGKLLPRKENPLADLYYGNLYAIIAEIWRGPEPPKEANQEALEKLERVKAHFNKKEIELENITWFRVLPINDENIKLAAIKVYNQWQQFMEKQKEQERLLKEQQAIHDKYVGLYPPKGIKNEH